jgi:hypothetical protein
MQVRRRQMPVLPDRNDPQAEACRAAKQRRDIGGRFEASGDDEDDRADNRCGCKKVDPQDGRDFGEKDIPDRIPARAADCAHHHGCNGGEAELQGFFRAGDGEQREAEGVHHDQRGFRNFLDRVESEERRERAQEARCHNRPAAQSLGRRFADQEVAQDAPARRRRKRHDDDAKGVEPLHGGNRRALNGEDKGSREVDGLQEAGVARGPVIHETIVVRVPAASQAMA